MVELQHDCFEVSGLPVYAEYVSCCSVYWKTNFKNEFMLDDTEYKQLQNLLIVSDRWKQTFECSMTTLSVARAPHFLQFLKSLQRHHSPDDWDGELFKPFTHSASLNCRLNFLFRFGFWVFWRWHHNEDMFLHFWRIYLALGAHTMSHTFGCIFFGNYVKIHAFWLSRISGSRIMAQKHCFWQKSKSFTKGITCYFRPKFVQTLRGSSLS